ncbi:MAG: haloacid dehalogenase [Candidatus Thorarchaeota archaeon]
MSLEPILEPILEEIESDDTIREKALPLSRKAVRTCSQSIKASHRGDFEKAESLLQEAHTIIEEGKQIMSKSDYISKSNIMRQAHQELAEAANVLSLLKDGTYTPPEKYNIELRSYLTGLGDTVGELRRAILDSLREDEVDYAESLLEFMEEILEELNGFDFPNALIPNLRHKCDVARSLIEKTRGDITSAVRQKMIVDELSDFREWMGNEK